MSSPLRTIAIASTTGALPWLESTPREGRETVRAELESLPFTIGRNDTCDLPVASQRVSREHARIEKSGGKYIVRDLGSTNGTYLNGVKVAESALTDGDLLTIADFGFVFHLPQENSRPGATQRFTVAEPHDSICPAVQLVEQVRSLQEVVLHRAVRPWMQAIVSVGIGEPVGYELLASSPSPSARLSAESFTGLPDAPGVRRALALHRMLGIEQLWHLFRDALVFVPLRAHEWESAELPDWIERWKQRPGGELRLVVELRGALPEQCQAFGEAGAMLRELGVATCLEAAGISKTILEAFECRPEFVRITPADLQAAQRPGERRTQLEQVIAWAGEHRSQCIGSDVTSESSWQTCKQLGVHLAQGDFAAAAMPIDGCRPTHR
jgi:EAL domain-containing protein (putative c-di-GMP-specific phosphodiesterase class I)